jgi:hypothetical protein
MICDDSFAVIFFMLLTQVLISPQSLRGYETGRRNGLKATILREFTARATQVRFHRLGTSTTRRSLPSVNR